MIVDVCTSLEDRAGDLRIHHVEGDLSLRQARMLPKVSAELIA